MHITRVKLFEPVVIRLECPTDVLLMHWLTQHIEPHDSEELNVSHEQMAAFLNRISESTEPQELKTVNL